MGKLEEIKEKNENDILKDWIGKKRLYEISPNSIYLISAE